MNPNYAELKEMYEDAEKQIENLEGDIKDKDDEIRELEKQNEELEEQLSVKGDLSTNTLDKEMMYEWLVQNWDNITLEDLKCLVP